MLTISIENTPSEARYWYPAIYSEGAVYYSQSLLALIKSWETSITGVVDFRTVIFNSATKYIAHQDLDMITLEDNKTYIYSWSNNSMKEVGAGLPGLPKNFLPIALIGGLIVMVVAVVTRKKR